VGTLRFLLAPKLDVFTPVQDVKNVHIFQCDRSVQVYDLYMNSMETLATLLPGARSELVNT